MNARHVLVVVSVSCFLILGFIFRSYRMLDWLPWNADSGRDFTVARRMIIDNGPYFIDIVSGSNSRFVLNSPFYFLLTAALYALTNSVISVCFFYALWNTFGLYIAYKIGCLLGNKQLGILCCIFISGNYFLVAMSRMIWQQTILPTLVLATIYTLLNAIASRRLLWIFLSCICVLIGSLAYYGYLPIAFVTGIYICILILSQTAKIRKAHYIFNHYVSIVIACVGIYLFTQLPFFDIKEYIVWITHQITVPQLINQSVNLQKELATFLFYKLDTNIANIVIGVSSLFILIETWKRKTIIHSSTVLLAYLFSFCLLSFYPEDLYFGRIIGYYPIFLICIAYGLYLLGKKNALLFWSTGVFLAWQSTSVTFSFLTTPPPQTYARTATIVKRVIIDVQKEHAHSNISEDAIAIHAIDKERDEIDWATGQYWYFLETIRDRKYITLVNDGNNLQPVTTNPKLHYLICKINTSSDTCSGLKTFIDVYKDTIDLTSQTTVTNEISDGIYMYRIYKWKSTQL